MAPPSQSQPPQTMYTSATSIHDSPLINLILRVLTLLFLFVSLIIIATNTWTVVVGYEEVKGHFDSFIAYRYMLFTLVFGIVYMLLQIAFTLYLVINGKRITPYTFDFYADKVVSYALATGAAATFGVTVDFQTLPNYNSSVQDFSNKANASASLLLIAFVFSAISSIFSSLALPK